jgi:hypothetical protein
MRQIELQQLRRIAPENLWAIFVAHAQTLHELDGTPA